jgi:hypothetical protein
VSDEYSSARQFLGTLGIIEPSDEQVRWAIQRMEEARAKHREQAEEPSTVAHPPHYTFGRFEVIDVLEDWFPTDPLLFNVGKYIARASRKGHELQDLEKAQWYLQRRIDKMKVAK